jgi:thioredoxin reductase (NADPH)
MLYDVLILGAGPAGLSSSIYTARGGLSTMVISHGRSPLGWAGNIDNYLGFPEGIMGSELQKRAMDQARRFGVVLGSDEIVAIEVSESGIRLKGIGDEYFGRTLLLATGHPPQKLSLDGAEKFTGNGVAYCATCDGFFYKGLKVGVLGFKDFAIEEALELKDYTEDITIYTNGRELVLSERYAKLSSQFRIIKDKISGLLGDAALEYIVFQDGRKEKADGLFIASGSASSLDFARKTGIITEEDHIVVDTDQKTNIEGIFAAGACTSFCRGVNQIATSVGQGALAGKKILEYLGRSAVDYYNMRNTD